MAWQDTIVPIVRSLINDISDDPTSYRYSDGRLEMTVVIAAQLITQFEVDFDIQYVIYIPSPTITPDPTNSPQDNSFINLVALRAAMIIIQAEVQQYALQAIVVHDGPSSIDYTHAADLVKQRFQEIKAQYEHARLQYQAGNRVGPAIISRGREFRVHWGAWGRDIY